VDFSARHYRRYADEVTPITDAVTLPGCGFIWLLDHTEDRIRWTRHDDPPAWVWTEKGHAEGLAYYVPDEGACQSVWPLITSDPTLSLIGDSARRHYAALAAATNQVG
jgi:hypothetical protein